MGNKFVITRENIILKSRFYDLVIPRDSAISFLLHDCRSVSGLPIFLELKAEKQKIVSRFFVGRLVYFCHKFLSSFLSPISRWHYLPNFIYFEKNILSILEALRVNGYAVNPALIQMVLAKNTDQPASASCCWPKPLRQIIALVFFSGLIIFIYAWLICQRLSTRTFVFFVIFFFFLCWGVYSLFGQIKKES